jgi:hypothetical protein
MVPIGTKECLTMATLGTAGRLTLALALWAACPPATQAQDASSYRGFRLGMTVAEVSALAGVPQTEAVVAFDRPAVIRELTWHPPSVAGAAGSASMQDSVSQVLFDFYDGELYRMVVGYRPESTEGLTEQDLLDALAGAYGTSRASPDTIITSPASRGYTDSAAVAAKWDDSRASVNLFRTEYPIGFGLVIYSKTLAPQARAAIDEAVRLEQADAPRRDLLAQQARDAREKAEHLKARAANKVAFRY